jgi:STE24 endopeptidase
LCRSFGYGPVLTGLLFGGSLFVFLFLFDIPFSLWHTFIIEQKYGFNKTTPTTFVIDKIKGLLLGTLLFLLAAGFILWFFEKTGSLAWLYSWGTLTAFQILLVFIAPVVIAPLFNKFIPLADGELKTAIEDYARKQNFALKGVYMMDHSKRSTKSNAYFTGFGKSRRIVLFDTLISRHTVDELVAVLAHEIGHYKKRHIAKNILFSMASTFLMFFLLSLFLENKDFFAAFGMRETSTYAGLVFFSFLYTPLNALLGIVSLHFSRQYEYEADLYAVKTSGKKKPFVEALKKLSVDNLSNLHPHPMKVFLEYSHPPVLERIRAIEKIP